VEDTRLGLDRRVVVQGTARNNDRVDLFHLPRQPATARAAENVGKPFRLGHLERPDLLLAPGPFERTRLKKQVRGVSRTRRLAAARTMAVEKTFWLAGHLVHYGAAQAAALQSRLAHGVPKSFGDGSSIRHPAV